MQPHIFIQINGTPFQLGQPLPDEVQSLVIEYQSLFPVPISRLQYLELAQWFNQVIDKCTADYVEFNKVLIPTAEVTKFKL